MQTVTKPMYQCDHCKKWYHRKHAAESHEKGCFHNPDNVRACLDCKHCKMEAFDVDISYDGDTWQEARNIFYCDKIVSAIHPPKIEHKGNPYKVEGQTNKPMPRECEHIVVTNIGDTY